MGCCTTGHRQRAAGDAVGGVWRDERQRRQAVPDIQKQTHLVVDGPVHRDLRLIHRFFHGPAAGDQCVRQQPELRSPERPVPPRTDRAGGRPAAP